MAVSGTASRVPLNCNGSITAFPFDFPIIESSDLKVILTDAAGTDTVLTETTHYVVSAVNNDFSGGGTVTTVATYATGNTITISRNVPLTQDTVFIEGMLTLYKSFEAGLDKQTMIAQQLSDRLDRSLTVAESEPMPSSLELPNAASRAGKYLSFNADGVPIASTEITPGSLSLSPFAETILDDSNAAEARATLGLDNVTNNAQMPLSYLDTDGTLAADSDVKVPSQKAVKTKITALHVDAEHEADGTHKFGVVQVKTYQRGDLATGTTVMPVDDTIPVKTEGNEYLTCAITPKSATNTLEIDVSVMVSTSVAGGANSGIALFQDDITNALAARAWNQQAANTQCNVHFHFSMVAGTTSATTFKVRIGPGTSGTITLNGANGARFFGGVAVSSITITEVIGS